MPPEFETAVQKTEEEVKPQRGFVNYKFPLGSVGKKAPKCALEHLVAHSPAYPNDNSPHGIILMLVAMSRDSPAVAGAQARRSRLRF